MSILESIKNLVTDPPPAFVFELSEAGVAYSRLLPGGTPETGFAPYDAGTLMPSPIEDNIKRPETIATVLDRFAAQAGSRKSIPAAVILPDFAARVSVLDFDQFPSAKEEQMSLIRFRIRKTVPFDVDSAALSYFVQPAKGAKGKIEVVTVTVALEVIARYEALFRQANFHAGEITTSGLAALNLFSGTETAAVAKLSGRTLTVMVVAGGALKLYRCVELEQVSEEEILSVLYPTLAYVEDELGDKSARVVLCGFPQGALAELEGRKDVLRAGGVTPGPFNAGLLGYLGGAVN
jgi:type IV pilus assembly protein PilM